MRVILLFCLSLATTQVVAKTESRWRACLNALTGARRYAALDVRDWKGLDEPSPYAGLITPQWHEWDEKLRIEGTLPTDFEDGVYLKLGPVGFDSKSGQRKRSMIDSVGGLFREYRLGAEPSVRVRQVKTRSFVAELEAGRFLYPSISTLVKRGANGMKHMQNQASVAPYRFGANYIATDELQRPIGMGVGDLETLGEVILDPSAPDAKYLAHAKREPGTDNWCHVEFTMGAMSRGRVICIDPTGQVVSRTNYFDIPAARMGKAPYVHDWALTKNYVVFYLQSYFIYVPGLLKAVAGVAPMMNGLFADPKTESKVAVFSRENGSLHALVGTGEAGLTWHLVNGYDENGEVTLDLTGEKITKKVYGLGESMRYTILGKELPYQADRCFLKRLRVNVADNTLLENTVLRDDANYEFPAVAPRVSGLRHRFAYLGRCHGARPWFTGVTKYDYETGAAQTYKLAKHEFAGEPMFAPRRGGSAEDDGYVLIEVYDGQAKATALFIFDAKSVDQGPVAKLWLSRHLPFGFHGLWTR